MTDYKFDPSDFGSDDSGSTDSSSGGYDASGMGLSLFLLPLSIVGVYAAVAKASVLAAVEAIIGTGGVALAITNAFWVGGVITVGALVVLGILTVLNILAAPVKRSGVNAILAILGVLYGAIGTAGAMFLFDGVPYIVGFVLTTNLAIGAIIVIVLFGVGLGLTLFA